ncbi:hypothetical protein D3C85_1563550 [compost metagenome]
MTPSVLVVVKTVLAVDEPLHTTWLLGCSTFPEGFTLISTVIGVPVQVPIAGVIVYLTRACVLPVFVSVSAIVDPEPFVNPVADPLITDAVQE